MASINPPQRKLSGCRVLVVEDDYFIARDVESFLEALGCEIVGPFSCIEDSMQHVERETPDAAVLDVNVAGRAVYPLASALIRQKVPVLFVTGYDPRTISPKFRSVPHLVKPINSRRLQNAVAQLILNPLTSTPQTMEDSARSAPNGNLLPLNFDASRPLS